MVSHALLISANTPMAQLHCISVITQSRTYSTPTCQTHNYHTPVRAPQDPATYPTWSSFNSVNYTSNIHVLAAL